jgi:hypothetical protein
MEYIKSKFALDSIFYGIFMLIFILPIGIYYIVVTIQDSIIGELSALGAILILVVVGGICLFVLNFIDAIRYIIVKGDKLTYYSVLRPFGKTLNFKDYIGKIVVQERGSGGSYNVVYLKNKNNRTDFKITGVHYKSFDEINKTIPLKKIDFNPTVKEYYRLLFFERITIKESSINKGENKKLNKMLITTQIIVIIGLLLFVIGSLLRRFFA